MNTMAPTSALLNESLLETLFRRQSQVVYRLCYRYTRNREDAEDLVQQIFLKIHGSFSQFKGQSQPMTWVHRIAVNQTLDHLRWLKRQARLREGFEGHLESFASSEDGGLGGERRRLLRSLVPLQEDKTRRILELLLDGGLTHGEIASLVGLSRVAVTKRIGQFQKRVQEEARAQEAGEGAALRRRAA